MDEDGKIMFRNNNTGVETYTDPRIVFAQEEKENPLDIRQRYDHSTKALQILHGRDLSNYTAIVTGANTGIGEYLGIFKKITCTCGKKSLLYFIRLIGQQTCISYLRYDYAFKKNFQKSIS